jgi:hypothetical protein
MFTLVLTGYIVLAVLLSILIYVVERRQRSMELMIQELHEIKMKLDDIMTRVIALTEKLEAQS